MVALEAKYHKSCLIQFYNRLRKHNNKKENCNFINISYGLAVEEIIEHITGLVEHRKEITPVFQLQTLTNLVIDRMVDQGVSQEDAAFIVHKTRLQTLLVRLPNLRMHQQGRSVLFTVEGEAGDAIFTACDNVKEFGGYLKKTADILRNDIFEISSKNL